MIKRIAGILPILGVAVFLLLYFYAAWLYPKPGYEHLNNYWCELYNPVTHSGAVNPGRPYALASIPILATTLLFFWFSVSALFVEFRWLCWTVRITGAISMAAASFIFTPAHDFVITVAVPLGVCAMLATCVGLARERRWVLVGLAILAMTVCSFDYIIWKLGALHDYQPMIQKSAFALFFLWVLATAIKALRSSG